jgi:hypothetical protein
MRQYRQRCKVSCSYSYITVILTYNTSSGIIDTYQRRLKALHPRETNITYNIEELYQFIDGYTELAALVYEPNSMAYAPKDKNWIKERIHNQLARAQRR